MVASKPNWDSVAMQTIYRTKKERNYTVVQNEWINNPALSAKAKGILLYLLSKPDNWVVRLEDIISAMADGESSIRGGVRELTEFGHLENTRIRDEAGRLQGFEVIVHELPMRGKNPHVDNPRVDNPHVDNPHVDNPHVDNQVLLNTNRVSTDQLSTDQLSTDQLSTDQEQDARATLPQAVESAEPTDKGKKSAIQKAPTGTKAELYQAVKEVYNASRPPNWAECRAIAGDRRALIDKALRDHGEGLLQMIVDAMEGAGKDRRFWGVTPLEFDTLFRKSNLVKLSEKNGARLQASVRPAKLALAEWFSDHV